MYKKHLTRRVLSLIVVTAMMTPVFSTVAEAAMATWLSPQPGQKITARNVEVAVGYNTQSNLEVTRLELWIDDNFYTKKQLIRPESRGVCSFWWDTSRYADGPHDLVIKIFAGDRLISKVSATGSVGNTRYDMRPPTVAFANVKAGDVLKGSFNIKLNATDDSGEAPLVSLLVDHSLKLVKNRPPYSYELDTTSYADGGHELETYAYDNSGNKSDPSVVKVSFKNNAERPVVASVKVDPNEVPAGNDDDAAPGAPATETVKPEPVKPVPPVSAPVVKHSAQRAATSAHEMASGKLAAPIAAPRPKPSYAPIAPALKTVASAPKSVAPLKIVHSQQSAVGSRLLRIAEPQAKLPKPGPQVPSVVVAAAESARPAAKAGPARAQIRKNDVRPASVVIAKHAAEPVQDPSVSTVRPVPVASRSQVRSSATVVAAVPKGLTEPSRVLSAPESSSVTRMAMAAKPSLRSGSLDGVMSATTASPEEFIADAEASGVRSVSVPRPAKTLRSSKVSGLIARAKGVPTAPVTSEAKASAPKPVRVAAAPFVRDANALAASRTAMVCPPPAPRDTRAKLEKRAVPVSGKVKLRDLFNKLGGLLFWDSESHTVTAYSDNLTIEFKIGSDIAKVNGKQMRISSAPIIAGGRTIIDARVYHEASAFALHHSTVGSSKTN